MELNKLKTIISLTLGVEESLVVPEASLFDDFNCSELEVHDLLIKICHEMDLNYEIDEYNMPELSTVQDIITFCEEHSDEVI